MARFDPLLLLPGVAFLVCAVPVALEHIHADDDRRSDLVECLDGWEESAALNGTCLRVVDLCYEIVTSAACACWLPAELRSGDSPTVARVEENE